MCFTSFLWHSWVHTKIVNSISRDILCAQYLELALHRCSHETTLSPWLMPLDYAQSQCRGMKCHYAAVSGWCTSIMSAGYSESFFLYWILLGTCCVAPVIFNGHATLRWRQVIINQVHGAHIHTSWYPVESHPLVSYSIYITHIGRWSCWVISWLPGYGYLNSSMLASKRQCKHQPQDALKHLCTDWKSMCTLCNFDRCFTWSQIVCSDTTHKGSSSSRESSISLFLKRCLQLKLLFEYIC